MPFGKNALDWQYEADRRTERRKQALWGDAQNVMRQGTDLMQTYRPGGSAALASGLYQSRGAMYGNQAMNTESPDLLMRYREEKQKEADDERRAAEKSAQKQAMVMGLVQAGATVAGAYLGGVGGAAAAAAVPRPEPQPQDPPAPDGPGGPGPIFRDDAAGPSGGSGISIGGGGSMPGSPSGQVGSGGAGGGNRRMPSGAGAGAGAGGKGGAEGLQNGANLQLRDDGNGPMSMFSGQEAAYNAMLANQGRNDAIYSDWRRSPVRSESTMARIRAARFRMAKSYYPA